MATSCSTLPVRAGVVYPPKGDPAVPVVARRDAGHNTPGQPPLSQQKNAPVPCRDESVNLAVPPCLFYLIVLVDQRQNLLAPSPSDDLAAMGCPDNAGPAEPSTAPNRYNQTTQSGGSILSSGANFGGEYRAGLPVNDPASLAAFLVKIATAYSSPSQPIAC